MDKPKVIINSQSKEEQFKLILDTGSNVILINKRLISKEIRNYVHKAKAKINFPLLTPKKKLDIIDVLFGNDILKDSIINQKDKIIKLNNSTYKINYQQSNQLHFNIKDPRKHVTVSNDNKSESHNLLDDGEDIKEQVTKFVEIIPWQIYQINNYRRERQEIEPIKKQIYYSTDDHKRHVEDMVLKFIDLGIIKRSESNHSSPIMLLRKRYSWRVVHDYRQLNKVTVREDHPFTPVDSLLNQCKDSKLFPKFDMIMGYSQVLINPDYKDYYFSLNIDSLSTLNSFYNQNIVTQLYQKSKLQNVHKNINKKNTLKTHGIKLVTNTTVPIPKSVESEMKNKPQKIEFNSQTELTKVDDTNCTVNIFN
ncbi:hypothetical protein ACTFIW_013313 [Dictyostelium discoideum]